MNDQTPITQADKEAAEKYAKNVFAESHGVLRAMAAEIFTNGILHERVRAEAVLVRALQEIVACGDSDSDGNYYAETKIANEALKAWRGET